MMPSNGRASQTLLRDLARRAMLARGLAPEFPRAALAELDAIRGPATTGDGEVRDLRALPWCSIDNDDSRDLDQLSVGEALPEGRTKLLVAIADVAGLVPLRSALDGHARQNTTSVYTAAETFPMLPEKLSTNLTSLNFESDRVALVVEFVVAPDGAVERAAVHQALVRNRAKLAYHGVAQWLEGAGPMPPAIGAVPGLDENIRRQMRAAQQLKALRHTRGALSFETEHARPVFRDGELSELACDRKNPARDLIEDLMIAANGATAQFLAAKKFPSIRRVVRTPERWERIVELAAEHGAELPRDPDPVALEKFLQAAKAADPVRFPDLSLSVIKLLGKGEYVVEFPGEHAPGHFGLAVKDYAHSTAPNRRYPDLITQRLLKAALAGRPAPHARDELLELARHCTEQEDAAKKVERQIVKSAAALLLQSQLGRVFEGFVTGASDKGTWVRLIRPPVEGRLVAGFAGRAVGERLRVQLIHTDVERGIIDFKIAR